jgi:EAL domain-containing protein (putative c-di-GMP-specific phosphodiesterase class I)
MVAEKESAIIVQALTGLGIGLGLTITAEGIEEGEERDALLHLRCQQGQGYLFGRAMSAAETATLFAAVNERSEQVA